MRGRMRHSKRVIVDAYVSADDVVRGFDLEEVRRVDDALAHIVGVSVDEEPALAERVVGSLLGCSLESSDLHDTSLAHALENADADVDAWLEVVERLRVRDAEGFCRVWNNALQGVPSAEFVTDGDTLVPSDRADVVEPFGVYTLPVDFVVPPGSSDEGRCAVPRASRDARIVRPSTASEAEVQELAERLRPRAAAAFDGEARTQTQPVLAPICAVVATVSCAMRSVSRMTRGERLFRPEALESCLSALDLGVARETLERILFRDHPAHLHLNVAHLPPEIADLAWGGALSLFARDEKDRVIEVRSTTRRACFPRVLFSVCGPDPY